MKVLMLVLASDTDERYSKLQTYWRRYMNSSPEIDCYFYKGDPTLQEDAVLDISSNTLWLKINESWDTILQKTKMAFKFFSSAPYDFIFRTNLSSFIYFDRYLEYCKGLPRSEFCSAAMGLFDKIPFPSGSGYTLTPDLMKRIADSEYPQNGVADDVYVGFCLQQWNVPIHQAKRIDFYYPEDRFKPLDEYYHLRIKSFFTVDDDWSAFEMLTVTEGLRIPANESRDARSWPPATD
jgi:hypothetical protein